MFQVWTAQTWRGGLQTALGPKECPEEVLRSRANPEAEEWGKQTVRPCSLVHGPLYTLSPLSAPYHHHSKVSSFPENLLNLPVQLRSHWPS